MIRLPPTTSSIRLNERVRQNRAPPIAAPYGSTSSPYSAPPQGQQSQRPASAPQSPNASPFTPRVAPPAASSLRPTATPPSQAPQGSVSPSFGRTPQPPPISQPPPSGPGWSNPREDQTWKNTWESSGQGIWDNTTGVSEPWKNIPGLTPANIDKDRLQPPRDLGLRPAFERPTYIPPAEVEPRVDANPTAAAGLGYGGPGPAGSPPPPADSGIGVQQSGLEAGQVGTHTSANDPTGQDATSEQNLGDRSEEYRGMSDEQLDAAIEDALGKPFGTPGYEEGLIESLTAEKERRRILGNQQTKPDQGYIDQVAKDTGLPADAIASDYENGYYWAKDPTTQEWRRYSREAMVDAALELSKLGYDRGDNPYMDAILDAINEGRMPDLNDVEMAKQQYDGDEEITAWLSGFRGESVEDIRSRGGYPDSGQAGDGSPDWQSEMNALFASVMEELGKPYEPFDESALNAKSALDRSGQMRAALELGASQGASTGQLQSALTDIGLGSEAELNAQVADRRMAEQVAQHQRNLSLIQQATQMLLAQQSMNLSAEEAAANRQMQLRLAQMSAAQENRMLQIEQERQRQQTFWGALGGIFGGLLGLGGQLGGGYLARPA